ncbi:hypothetical protein R1flu_022707 [Riccia fluitans]|uniref:Uncharacterized protein n=1 Tax=Riccia fluitans TaxID=41844 RepID=A0ABD1XPZ2_9MARC
MEEELRKMQFMMDVAQAQLVEIEAELACLLKRKEELVAETMSKPRFLFPHKLTMKTVILNLNKVLVCVSKAANDFTVALELFGDYYYLSQERRNKLQTVSLSFNYKLIVVLIVVLPELSMEL